MSLPALADLKAHLNLPTAGGADDAELAEMLDAAVNVVEGIIGPITAASVTETHRGVRSDVIVLRRTPVVDLVSVSSRYGSSLTAESLGDFELDAESGLLRRADGYGFAGSFTVTYSVGRPSVPADIRLAILIIAAHLFETQRMPGLSAASAPAGFGGADGIPDTGDAGRGFAIPRRAEELLHRYTPTVIA